MRTKVVAALLVSTVVFQHFQFVTIAGYRLTIGVVTGLLLVALASKKVPWARLTAVWVPLIALGSLAAILAPEIARATDFFSTLSLVLLTSFILVVATGGLRDDLIQSSILWKTVLLALCVVVLISVGQAVLGALGSDVLFNPFGRFQFQNEYAPYLSAGRIPRAQGFFLEPSYDAFVIGTLTIALMAEGRYFRQALLLGLAGMAATQSATGLVLMLCVLVGLAIKSRPSVALLVAIGGAVLFAFFGGYVVSRLASIGNIGSSGNYRLLAPLQVLQDVLAEHPFGLPFGSIYDVVGTYGLVMDGQERSASLDNGAYVLVYYFGWFGVVGLLVMLVWALRAFAQKNQSSNRTRYYFIAPAWILGSLIFSGAIVAPEYGLMNWIVITAYISASTTTGMNHAKNSLPLNHLRHIPRHPGHSTHA